MNFRTISVSFLVGALYSATTIASAQNLVVNGGFETGDLTGWTNTGSGSAFVVTGPVNSGSYAAKLTPGTSDNILGQTINTVAGTTYTFSLYLINTGRAGDNSDFDKITWDGATVAGSPSFVPGDNIYHEYSFNVLATGTTSTFGIEAYNPSGNYFLDDVSVVPAPEPSSIAFGVLATASIGLVLARRR